MTPLVLRVLRSAPVRWAGLVALTWVMLRPALLVTISLDDLINPFDVLHDYGPSPFADLVDVNREVFRNGHFNVLGQTFGAIVFRVFTFLVSSGVRYSFVYALTKLIVFVVTAVAGARLLRTLAALTGRTLELWWSRLIVALALFATLQLHVAWSLDPVGSFPLSGYLSVTVGLLALDAACRAVPAGDVRSAAIAAVALCLSILYYEINVAMIVALVPIVVLHAMRSTPRRVLLRSAAIVAPAAVMTLVLQAAAAAANRGYTGTDVGVGDNTPTVVVRTVAGSLPASSWPQARDWLAESVGLSVAGVLCFLVAAAVVVAAVLRAPRRDGTVDRRATLLVAAVPAVVWLAATLVQATTQKVRAETPRVGFVYNYYAYGSVGLVLAALLLVPLVPRLNTAVRFALLGVAVAFVFAQTAINDHVHRKFGEILRINRDVLAAYTDEAPLGERCAALDAWLAWPFGWEPYYRDALVTGMNASYLHYHDEPFCDTVTPTG